MKRILCKKDYYFFSELYFLKGKQYSIVEDSNESCLVIVESENKIPYSSHRFYYKDYFGVSEQVPIFERYFDNIKDVRKKKLIKLNESSI